MKEVRYAVGEEWIIVDEETQQWVNGVITEVGDETICIKWDDIEEETEYQICDMPRIFHSNANRVVNHPLFEQFSKLLKAYPDDAKTALSELTGGQTWEEIDLWLEEHREILGVNYWKEFKHYAIIDDDDDMLLRHKNNFFQTDATGTGLNEEICAAIIKHLNH